MTRVIAFALAAFSAIFSVVDPLGAVPVYLAMTAADSREHRRRTALRASISMFVILAVFAASGVFILRFFGISLGSFRIAGGVLLFLLAVDMVRAQPSRQRTTPEEQKEGTDKPDISLFPLAFPILSGPGAVATVMVMMARAHGLVQYAIVYAAVFLTAIGTYITLEVAAIAGRRVSQTGLNVLHRVMGLLLAAIAVQFVVDGAKEILPTLLSHQ
jgi:multiple antibiotic resistance protein